MVTTPQSGAARPRYDKRDITYAHSFETNWQSTLIRAIEWFTGKIAIIRMVRAYERRGGGTGLAFWAAALKAMGITISTPEAQLRRIPTEGPVVVVANHPHGLVDGMVMAEIIGRRREDFRILTREVLTGLDEAANAFLIPVPFPHAKDAQEKGVEMRSKAMEVLKAGGLVCIFPSGVVASSRTAFGPVEEAEWNVFTAQMIRRSGATVVPIHFLGQNSRWYQVANRVSATLRQGLLLHEVVHVCNRPHGPVIGAPLTEAQLDGIKSDPRGWIAWLRGHTLSLDS